MFAERWLEKWALRVRVWVSKQWSGILVGALGAVLGSMIVGSIVFGFQVFQPELSPPSIEFADRLVELGQVREAARYYEGLIEDVSEEDERRYADVRYKLGYTYIRIGESVNQTLNLNRAIALLQEAVERYEGMGERRMRALALRELGISYRMLAENRLTLTMGSRAVEALTEAWEELRDLEDDFDSAVAARNLGVSYRLLSEVSNRSERLDRAMELFGEARSVLNRFPESPQFSRLLLDIATAHVRRGEMAEGVQESQLAIANLDSALTRVTIEADAYTYSLLWAGKAQALYTLAAFGGMREEYEAALAAIERATAILTAERHPIWHAKLEINRQLIYSGLAGTVENPEPYLEAALSSGNSALAFFSVAEYPLWRARVLNNDGIARMKIFELTGDARRLEPAIENYEEVRSIFRQQDYPITRSIAALNLAALYVTLAEATRSSTYARRGVETAKNEVSNLDPGSGPLIEGSLRVVAAQGHLWLAKIESSPQEARAALECIRSAEAMLPREGYPVRYATMQWVRGDAFAYLVGEEQGAADSARVAYQQALELLDSAGLLDEASEVRRKLTNLFSRVPE